MAVMGHSIPIPTAHRIGHAKQHPDAIHQGRSGTHCNERVHIGAAVPQGFQATGEIHPVQKHHRQRQEALQQCRHQSIFRVMEAGRHRKTHHMAHGHIHEYRQKTKGAADAPFHGFLLGRRGYRFLLCLSGGSGSIAGLLHRFQDLFRYRFPGSLYRHGTGQQIDFRLLHSRHRRRDLLHPGGTGCAGHAGHLKCKLHRYVHPFRLR